MQANEKLQARYYHSDFCPATILELLEVSAFSLG